jgi:hypothetical protein
MSTNPHHGGSYVKDKNGKLKRVHEEQPAPADGDKAAESTEKKE